MGNNGFRIPTRARKRKIKSDWDSIKVGRCLCCSGGLLTFPTWIVFFFFVGLCWSIAPEIRGKIPREHLFGTLPRGHKRQMPTTPGRCCCCLLPGASAAAVVLGEHFSVSAEVFVCFPCKVLFQFICKMQLMCIVFHNSSTAATTCIFNPMHFKLYTYSILFYSYLELSWSMRMIKSTVITLLTRLMCDKNCLLGSLVMKHINNKLLTGPRVIK